MSYLLAHGGMITSAAGTPSPWWAYWMSWISSFWKMTFPGVTARLPPTSKAASSVIDTRPFARSSVNRRMPAAQDR